MKEKRGKEINVLEHLKKIRALFKKEVSLFVF
jgi:hypothetical protein